MELDHPLRVITPTVDADVLSVLALADSSFTPPEVHRVVGEHSEDGVRRALKRLTAQGIVLSERAGNAWLYRLNRDHLAAKAIVSIAQLRSVLLKRIGELVEAWDPLPAFVALFGSAGSGGMRIDSDIDLFVVRPRHVDGESEGWWKQVSDLEAAVHGWTGNDARVFELDEDEVINEINAGSPGVVADIAASGIVLFGPRRYLRRIVGA